MPMCAAELQAAWRTAKQGVYAANWGASNRKKPIVRLIERRRDVQGHQEVASRRWNCRRRPLRLIGQFFGHLSVSPSRCAARPRRCTAGRAAGGVLVRWFVARSRQVVVDVGFSTWLRLRQVSSCLAYSFTLSLRSPVSCVLSSITTL